MVENPLLRQRVGESELTPRRDDDESFSEQCTIRAIDSTESSAIDDSEEEEEDDDDENVLAVLFLVNPGNRETIRLLMRGMPIPATFGFPNTDGTVWSNLREFCKQFHPSISIKFAHPLHPFTRKERLVIFLCTVAFNVLWSAFTAYQRRRITRYVETHRLKEAFYLFIKHFATVIYAVVIRQLVICPGPYNSLIRRTVQEADYDYINANNDYISQQSFEIQQEAISPGGFADRQLQSRAKRLMKMKILGDRVLLWLLVIHIGVVACVIAWMSTWTYSSNRESAVAYDRNPLHAFEYLCLSEFINFFFWFIKFIPLFLFLYPIHRAQWYQGGSYTEYFCCSFFANKQYDTSLSAANNYSSHSNKSCWNYTSSPNYLNPRFPRCVRPETRKCASAKVRTLITDLVHPRHSTGGYHLSTFRRQSENFSSMENIAPRRRSDQDTDSSWGSKTVPLRLANYLSSKMTGEAILPRTRERERPHSSNDGNSIPRYSQHRHHIQHPLQEEESTLRMGDMHFEENSGFLRLSPTERFL